MMLVNELKDAMIARKCLQAPDEIRLLPIPFVECARARDAVRPRWENVSRAAGFVHKLPGKNGRRALVALDNSLDVALYQLRCLSITEHCLWKT